jgi:molybdopterin/thiamine biosynthesis adenylyltransferase
MSTEVDKVVHEVFEEALWYETMTDRNKGIISEEEQARISEVLICQAGVGGNSDVIITLIQMGFQHFKIADPDIFDLSNFNRQLGANIQTLNMNKAESIREEIKRINPNADVEVFPEGLTFGNVKEFLEGADIIIDGLDVSVMRLRKEMFDLARANRQPVFTCPVFGWGAALGIFDPELSPTFTEVFGEIPENPESPERQRFNANYALQFISAKPTGIDLKLAKRRAAEGKPPAIAASCRLNAAIVSTAVYSYLFKNGNIPVMPTSLHIDLLGAKLGKTGPKKRWLVKKAASAIIREE